MSSARDEKQTSDKEVDRARVSSTFRLRPETFEAAKEAAWRRRMSLNAWVQEVIERAVAEV